MSKDVKMIFCFEYVGWTDRTDVILSLQLEQLNFTDPIQNLLIYNDPIHWCLD